MVIIYLHRGTEATTAALPLEREGLDGRSIVSCTVKIEGEDGVKLRDSDSAKSNGILCHENKFGKSSNICTQEHDDKMSVISRKHLCDTLISKKNQEIILNLHGSFRPEQNC